MTQVTDSWELVEVDKHYSVKEPFLRLDDKYGGRGIRKEREARIYLNKAAYELIGKPEFARIMVSTANGMYRLKLLPSFQGIAGARPINIKKNQTVIMGGGPNLRKKYRLPCGYYILGDDGVFTWRYS